MDTIKVNDYTDTQKAELRLKPLSFIERMTVYSAWSKKDPEMEVYGIPGPTQVKFLLSLKRDLTNVVLTKPSQVIEQTLVRGGKVDYSVVNTNVELEVHQPKEEPNTWVIDTIPVQKAVLPEKPSIGRVSFFLASVTKVKKNSVVPMMENAQLRRFEVKLLNPDGIFELCSLMNAIIVKLALKMPEGMSGVEWVDYIYRFLVQCNGEDYLGIHSVILSRCLHVGSQKIVDGKINGIEVSRIMIGVMAQVTAEAQQKKVPPVYAKYFSPIPGPARAALVQKNQYYATLGMIGYWTGDLYAAREVISPPGNAVQALLGISSFVSNRGGKSGSAALVTGRLGIGLFTPTFEKMLEFLIVMWGLQEPYNVYGVTESMLAIWERSRLRFGYKDIRHTFIIPSSIARGVSRYPTAKIPSIRFDYRTLDNHFHLNPKHDVKQRAQSHGELVGAWAVTNFVNPRDMWVGSMIMPFGIEPALNDEEQALLKKMHASPLGFAHDARAIFSIVPCFRGTCSANTLSPEDPAFAEAKAHVDLSGNVVTTTALKKYFAKEWCENVVRDVFALSGHLLAQPKYYSLTGMRLFPAYKESEMYINDLGEWDMLKGTDGEIQFAVADQIQPVKKIHPSMATVGDDGVPININTADFQVEAEVPLSLDMFDQAN